VLAIALGFWIGLEAAIWCLAAVTLLYCAAMQIIPADVIGCRPMPMLRGLVYPVVASLIAAAAYLLVLKLSFPGAIWTIANLTFALSVYAITMLLIDRKHLAEDWTAIRKLIRSRNPSGYASGQ
jgi:hypothetical protein